jgi:hypothetical protein
MRSLFYCVFTFHTTGSEFADWVKVVYVMLVHELARIIFEFSYHYQVKKTLMLVAAV